MDRKRRTQRLIRKYGWIVTTVLVAFGTCYVLLPTYRIVAFIAVAYLSILVCWRFYGPRKR